jgi:serine/threonine protein kinase
MKSSEEGALAIEALALVKACHENVVRIMGFCTDPGHRCLLMEVAEMGSLRDVLEKHPDLPLWRRFDLLCGAEKAMDHLHTFQGGKAIVHGDLKPDNLLVCEGWVCKVADFGLVQGVVSEHGEALGGLTTRYAPPELLELHVQRPTTASDVFSYGMTVWEVITGERPWQHMLGDKPIVASVLSGKRPHIPAGCDEHFASLLPRCWAHEPAERISFEDICKRSEAAAPRFAFDAALARRRIEQGSREPKKVI